MDDVLIVGAGPAGTVAATLLARAGARVRILDRVSFPRNKLCGDTLNPGTLALLRRLGLAAPIERTGLRLEGMLVTGAGGIAVRGCYPDALHGLAVLRRDLDWALLRQAMEAGARFEGGAAVREILGAERHGVGIVEGVKIGVGRSLRGLRAPVTIAADGRRSALAFGLGLARHPPHPRRWAIGAYFEAFETKERFGEMHIRRGRYIGVAPVPGGITNVCVVKASAGGDLTLRDPESALGRELSSDPELRERAAGSRLVRPPDHLPSTSQAPRSTACCWLATRPDLWIP
jgi:flavin-dependent dehydrogenase